MSFHEGSKYQERLEDERRLAAEDERAARKQSRGHGHVTPNADGSKARCGGPGVCDVCSREYAAVHQGHAEPAAQAHTVGCECGLDTTFATPVTGPWACEACGRRYIGPLPSNAEERERRARARDGVSVSAIRAATYRAVFATCDHLYIPRICTAVIDRYIAPLCEGPDGGGGLVPEKPPPLPGTTAADWNDADRKR